MAAECWSTPTWHGTLSGKPLESSAMSSHSATAAPSNSCLCLTPTGRSIYHANVRCQPAQGGAVPRKVDPTARSTVSHCDNTDEQPQPQGRAAEACIRLDQRSPPRKKCKSCRPAGPPMIAACGDVRGLKVLDCGCGEGRFCRMVLRARSGIRTGS